MKNQNQGPLKDSGLSVVPQAPASPLSELESAKNQSTALLHLLLDSLCYHVEGSQWTHEFANKMSGGIAELTFATNERLERAVEALFDERRNTKTAEPSFRAN